MATALLRTCQQVNSGVSAIFGPQNPLLGATCRVCATRSTSPHRGPAGRGVGGEGVLHQPAPQPLVAGQSRPGPHQVPQLDQSGHHLRGGRG
ncbi:hypothetical protein CEXT_208041 [Caerostris extrusa]|uniref:Uncharacterized protein n=1 Tax=Caerostris extrusa TaxID=172846 RepID=A0AAV4MNF2_CAEEX|nr:hypothetical protein CEXT_208041 [Caerostris extrusa]